MQKQFSALFLPAYGVTLVAVPIAMMIDHLGRGATPWGATVALPIWIWSAAFFALPFILPAAGLAFLVQRLTGDWWRTGAGKAIFTILCAGLGVAAVTITIHSFGLIAAAAGGTAAWLSASPSWPDRWRHVLMTGAGVMTGTLVGIQYY